MRLLIVSNRLPITVVEEGGSLNFKESVGGLVSGLKSYLDSPRSSSSTKSISDYAWLGWPGTTIKEKMKDELKSRIHSETAFVSSFHFRKSYG